MPADLGRFNSTLVYSRLAAPVEALLDDLAELRAFDDKQEKINTAWTIAGTVGWPVPSRRSSWPTRPKHLWAGPLGTRLSAFCVLHGRWFCHTLGSFKSEP